MYFKPRPYKELSERIPVFWVVTVAYDVSKERIFFIIKSQMDQNVQIR